MVWRRKRLRITSKKLTRSSKKPKNPQLNRGQSTQRSRKVIEQLKRLLTRLTDRKKNPQLNQGQSRQYPRRSKKKKFFVKVLKQKLKQRLKQKKRLD